MIILYIVLGLIALILLIAALIGTGWSYEKSIRIQAPVPTVWGHINSLRSLNQWNPWMDIDPAIKVVYTGTDGTPGASFSWESDAKNVGAGSQTLLTITPQQETTSRIDFLRPFKGTGEGTVRLSEEKGGTNVSWGIVSSTPYPMNIIKLFGVIEKNMDRDFAKGLGKLKGLCEGGKL